MYFKTGTLIGEGKKREDQGIVNNKKNIYDLVILLIMYFIEYGHLKRFFRIYDIIFSLYVEDWNSGTFSELVVIITFCRCRKTNFPPVFHF